MSPPALLAPGHYSAGAGGPVTAEDQPLPAPPLDGLAVGGQGLDGQAEAGAEEDGLGCIR